MLRGRAAPINFANEPATSSAASADSSGYDFGAGKWACTATKLCPSGPDPAADFAALSVCADANGQSRAAATADADGQSCSAASTAGSTCAIVSVSAAGAVDRSAWTAAVQSKSKWAAWRQER